MIFSLLSAFLLFVSFLPFKGHFLFSYVAFFPFFLFLRNRSLRDFWIFGFLFYLLSLYWIPNTVNSYGKTGLAVAILAYFLLCLFLSFYFVLWGIMTKAVKYSLWGSCFAFVFTEYIRVKFFYGFPFLSLSHTHAGIAKLIQLASYTGQWGVTFLILLLNILLVFFVKNSRKDALLCVFLIFLGLFPAFLKESFVSKEALKVALIQPSLDEERKWEPQYKDENLEMVLSMIKSACNKIDLVVTPETTLPFYWEKDEERTHFTLKQLSSCKRFILLGIISYVEDQKRLFFINRAYLLKKGKIIDFYDKRILVPYGEFVPFREQLSFIYKFVELPEDFKRGKKNTLFKVKNGSFFVAICYEMAFPEYIARSSADANFLVNITNDMWFGKTIAPYLHLWASALRAVELRRYVVRCANTGISAVVDERGRILKSLPLFERGILYAKVRLSDYRTFYSKHPRCFIILMFIGWMFVLFYRLKS